MSPPAADGDLRLVVLSVPAEAAPALSDLLDEDPGRPFAMAIALALLFSLPFWALVIFAVYLLR